MNKLLLGPNNVQAIISILYCPFNLKNRNINSDYEMDRITKSVFGFSCYLGVCSPNWECQESNQSSKTSFLFFRVLALILRLVVASTGLLTSH